jgi:hypothetical protein
VCTVHELAKEERKKERNEGKKKERMQKRSLE